MTEQPPGYPPPPPARQPPNNHLVLSVVALLFCLVPAVVAVVKSSQVRGLWIRGRYAEAQATADSAMKWATWSIILGAIAWIALGIVAGMYGGDTNAAMF